MRTTEKISGVLLVLAGIGLLAWLVATPSKAEIEIGGFATSLRGRTASQRHNAEKAALSIDGKVIPPGGVFSFNKVVKSWSWDQGYLKAPVSYEGEMIRAYGGGVCQTSTTLYNAALLAGLPMLERHPHVFAAHYAPPGRDAAVAQFTVDLRFRNPYPWPIRLRAISKGERLIVQVLGREKPKTAVQVTTDVLSVTTPQRLTRVLYRPEGATGRTFLRNPGATGYRVVTHRVFTQNGREVRRERLGDDTYPAMNKIVQRTEEGGEN